jgi:hypothetical protein
LAEEIINALAQIGGCVLLARLRGQFGRAQSERDWSVDWSRT